MGYVSLVGAPRMRRPAPGMGDVNMEFDDPSVGSRDDEYLGTADALRLLRDPTVDSVAPVEVEALVWERISRCANPLYSCTRA
jgi:hypothetical protein